MSWGFQDVMVHSPILSNHNNFMNGERGSDLAISHLKKDPISLIEVDLSNKRD